MRAIYRIATGLVCVAFANGSEEQSTLNPIRKVVTLLQSMQQKVQDEGARELELYKKFMCYCKTGGGDLSSSMGAAEQKIPAVTSDIEEAEAKLASAKAALKQAQGDRAAAKAAMADATALREKEAAAFASLKGDHETNIAAIARAVAALEKGAYGAFLQTSDAQVLQRIVTKSDLIESDQEELTAFLTQSSGYAPQSGEIIGILKQMGDSMAAGLAEATATEQAAINTYNGLVQAKHREIAALTATIEAKTQQIGDLGVRIVMMKEDLADTQEALGEDKQFLADLESSCATKTKEWEERSKTRAAELVALADTIKVLNDDDALELFKKTLPSASASFLQVSKASRTGALSVLRSALDKANAQDRPSLQFLVLALTGKKSAGTRGFEKVVQMIDNLVQVLAKEQQDDIDKREFCNAQFDVSDDRRKAVERGNAGEEAEIASAKETISTLAQEIAALTAGIRALDTAVADATAQRKDENSEYKALIASNTAATEVLAFAKNRLNKFYNPRLYKVAPKVELSAEDRIFSSEGGVLVTAAPGGIAGTGITVLAQISEHKQSKGAPAAPPATWGPYAAKKGENEGVVAMLDLLIGDLAKEMAEAGTDEKNSQADYETMMSESRAKRTTDSKALAGKSSAKADMEAELQAHQERLAAGKRELMATLKYISSLHAECDWLLQYFDVRKEARAGEVDSLKRAKAVLNGADYSLLQKSGKRFLSRSA